MPPKRKVIEMVHARHSLWARKYASCTTLTSCPTNLNKELRKIEPVAVLVGEEIFQVDQKLLANSSKYFQNALKPEWRRDSTESIKLFDTEPDVLAEYVECL